MASYNGVPGDVTLALQNRIALPSSSDSFQSLSKPSSLAGLNNDDSKSFKDTRARETANKFEALLIHNMLKSMRKTTMSENKSNDRAIYDDMLDEKLANTMMEAGGIGIADQIVAQIKKQQGKSADATEPKNDSQRLRELATLIQGTERGSTQTNIQGPASSSENVASKPSGLQLVTKLWNNGQASKLNQRQREFVESILPYAKRIASKIGTSPNAIVAVAALESGWGDSPIRDKQGKDSHNLFGIKAGHADVNYATTVTTEYIEGSPQKLHARFKTYDSAADAVDGFAEFLQSNPRYSNALKHAGTPEKFLQELQTAGYATDPRYAEKTISIMRQIERSTLPL